MKKKLLVFLLCFLALLPKAAGSQEFSYTVELEYPSNQAEAVKGYYLLRVTPGMKQTLSMKVANNLDREQTFRIETTDAYTKTTGGMLYDKNLDFVDTKLLDGAIKLSEYLKAPESITVGPKEMKVLTIEVTAPDINEGTVLGGILVVSVAEKETVGEGNGGEANFVLQTENATATAVQLNYPKTLPPNFLVGEAGFKAETGEVYITFQNKVRMIQSPISGSYQVEDKQGKLLFEGEFNPFKMAPNTEIQYPLAWQGNTLEPGDYTLSLNLLYDSKTITESRSFSIQNSSVQEFIERNPEKTTTTTTGLPTWVWIVISTAIILIGFLTFLIIRMNKKIHH